MDNPSEILATLIVASSGPAQMTIGRSTVDTPAVSQLLSGEQHLALEFQRDGAVLGHRKTGGLSERQIEQLRAVLDHYGISLSDLKADKTTKEHFVWQDRRSGVGWRPSAKEAQIMGPEIRRALR